MTAFLFLVVLLLVIWVARNASKLRKGQLLLAQLTSRVFNLEQELKQFRNREQPGPATQPILETPPPAPVIPPEGIAVTYETPPVAAPEPEVSKQPPIPPPLPALAKSRRFSFRSLVNLEETLGTNWLNKLGIVILVIGVALFLAYEVRELGPLGKALVGYAVSFAMLAAGVFFERREQWRILARAGIAGGWSLLYFTTYAIYHVPAARVLSSEPLDLVLLLAVACAMVLHTLRYSSQVVTGLAFFLAFATLTISHGNAYSLIASAILAAGLAAVALRRRWFEMEIAGMVAAYLNHYLWLRPVIQPMHGHIHVFPGYTISAVLLAGYWLIFRASYVLRRVDTRRGEQVSTVAAVLNSALLLCVMRYQSVHPELAFQFLLAVGLIEVVLGQLPITRRRRAAFIVLTTLGCCLLVAAFPFRVSGGTLSAVWLAEAEALLLIGVFLREIVFRQLGMIAALVVWIQMVAVEAATVLGERTYEAHPPSYHGLAVVFGLAALAFYVSSQWLPRRWPHSIQNPLERLCFSRLAHLAGILAFIGAWIAWPGAWTAVAWAALAAALAYAGQRWLSEELSWDASAAAAVTLLRVLFVNLLFSRTHPHPNWVSERLVTVSLVVALLYIASRWSGIAGVITRERISPAYTWAASGVAALLIWYELLPVAVALGWSLLALVLLEAGLKWRSPQFRFQAYFAFCASFLRLFVVNLNAAGPLGEIAPRVFTIVPLLLAFYYAYARLTAQAGSSVPLERKLRVANIHCFFGTLAAAALLRFELDSDLVVVAWAALALLLVAFAWWSHRRIFLDQGLLLAFGVFFRGVFHNLYERSYFPAPFAYSRILLLGAAIALLLLALPFSFSLRQFARDTPKSNRFLAVLRLFDRRPEQVFFFVAFALCTALLAVEMRSGMVTLAWGVQAFAVFALALLVNERSYRLSALALLLLCVIKIVVRDVWGLAPRDRYLTFIVLGSALLAVSYLYTRFRSVVRQYL